MRRPTERVCAWAGSAIHGLRSKGTVACSLNRWDRRRALHNCSEQNRRCVNGAAMLPAAVAGVTGPLPASCCPCMPNLLVAVFFCSGAHISCVWDALKLCMYFREGGAGGSLIRLIRNPQVSNWWALPAAAPPLVCSRSAGPAPLLTHPLPRCLPKLVHNSAHVLQVRHGNAR